MVETVDLLGPNQKNPAEVVDSVNNDFFRGIHGEVKAEDYYDTSTTSGKINDAGEVVPFGRGEQSASSRILNNKSINLLSRTRDLFSIPFAYRQSEHVPQDKKKTETQELVLYLAKLKAAKAARPDEPITSDHLKELERKIVKAHIGESNISFDDNTREERANLLDQMFIDWNDSEAALE